MTRKKTRNQIIGVIDCETDPFKFGEVPAPFAWGLKWRDPKTGRRHYVSFWGKDCTARLIKYLDEFDGELLLYAHNGGKFDFIFLLQYLSNPVRIIKRRIVSAFIGFHEIRDSFVIIPTALKGYKKTEIDYDKFTKARREENRAEIESYLEDDCEYLLDLVTAFIDKFGPKLTIGSTAYSELTKVLPQQATNETHDKLFRPYYIGGRVQCFQKGIIHGDFKIIDVNSMYPATMCDYDHPFGPLYVTPKRMEIGRDGRVKGFETRLYFIEFEGISTNALPMRIQGKGYEYGKQRGIFKTTSHELIVALKWGLVKIDRIIDIKIPVNCQRFGDFINPIMAAKIAAEINGDAVGRLFSKLLANNGYGKFGQNPDNFHDYFLEILDRDNPPSDPNYQCGLISEDYRIWEKPTEIKRYYDVAIAASITGAARAVLLDSIMRVRNPVYCDTDSIICESTGTLELDASKLGAWKDEGRADTIAIAGKKLYAAFLAGECIKTASKGLRLSPEQIYEVASGGSVEWRNDAPSFALDGSATFVKRRARRTA